MKNPESIDLWYKIVTGHEELRETDVLLLKELLQNELPTLSSLLMERTCNLSCAHCIFQDEKSSRKYSDACNLEAKILTIASQLPNDASIIHEGRILRDWHIPILAKIRNIRPDISIGLIDNGTYLAVKNELDAYEFEFDWIDISIDGTEKIHNQQRKNNRAFDTASDGLEACWKYVKRSGRITSLFTATKINFGNVYEAASVIMESGLITELHVTPQSPTFREDDLLMSVEDYKIFWNEFKKVHALGAKLKIPVYIRFYKHDDLRKLAEAIGVEIFKQGFTDKKTMLVSRGTISFIIDGIRVNYIPISICSTETFVIDADGYYRLAYSVKFTLEELRSNRRGIEDISAYTVCEIQESDSYSDLYKKGARQWWEKFGKALLLQEKELFNNLTK